MMNVRYATPGTFRIRGLTADTTVLDRLYLPVSLGAKTIRSNLYDVEILAAV